MKKIVSIILMLTMLLSVFAISGVADETAEAPEITPDVSWYDETATTYTLADAADLLGFAGMIGEGNDFDGKTVELAADIDLNPGYNGESDAPTNVWPDTVATKNFHGTFDGKGHYISGIYLSNILNSGIGIFGNVYGEGKVATVKDLSILNSWARGKYVFGSVFGGVKNGGTANITNVYSDVDMVCVISDNGVAACGGIVGHVEVGGVLNMSGCVYAGNITPIVPDAAVRCLAGLVGRVNNEPIVNIDNCAFYGSITVKTELHAKLVARHDSSSTTGKMTITNCIAGGELNIGRKPSNYVAALFAASYSMVAGGNNVSNCLYTDVTYTYINEETGKEVVEKADVPFGLDIKDAAAIPVASNNNRVTDEELTGSGIATLLTEKGMQNWTARSNAAPIPTGIQGLTLSYTSVPVENGGEDTTTGGDDETTAGDDETTAKPEKNTTDAATNAPETEANTNKTDDENSGCASTVFGGLAVILLVAGAVVTVTKKKND